MNEEPLGVLHSVRERRDRAGNAGVLGMQPLGMGAGAGGDQERGGDPSRHQGRRQQRQQEIGLPREDPRREPDADDDERQRVDGCV